MSCQKMSAWTWPVTCPRCKRVSHEERERWKNEFGGNVLGRFARDNYLCQCGTLVWIQNYQPPAPANHLDESP